MHWSISASGVFKFLQHSIYGTLGARGFFSVGGNTKTKKLWHPRNLYGKHLACFQSEDAVLKFISCRMDGAQEREITSMAFMNITCHLEGLKEGRLGASCFYLIYSSILWEWQQWVQCKRNIDVHFASELVQWEKGVTFF